MIDEYLVRAIFASLITGVLLGFLSPLINMKRIAFLTHATFHSLLLGAILGMIVGLVTNNLELIFPISLVVVVITTLIIAKLELAGYSPDTSVGTMTGIVAGLTLLGFGVLYKVMASKPYFGLSESIVSYLTGEIFLTTFRDLWILTIGGGIALMLMLAFYRDFVYLSFDPEGLESHGGKPGLYLVILYLLVGAIAGLIVKTVGLITLQVLSVLPGAIGIRIAKNIRELVFISLSLTLIIQLFSVIFGYYSNIPPV